MRHAAGRLRPDFRACCAVVRKRIVRVVELVKLPPFTALSHGISQVARTLHAFFSGREDQLRTIGLNGRTALRRRIGWQDDLHPIPFQGRDHGERDAGIAARRFNECVARLDISALFSLFNHGSGSAVLDGAGRIIAFELHPNFTAVMGNKVLKTHERRSADNVDYGFSGHTSSLNTYQSNEKRSFMLKRLWRFGGLWR